MTRLGRALLSGLVDYAGLFPPAGLSMSETVANYSAYQRRADSWALARLVVPVARLGEFEASLAQLPPSNRGKGRWPISGLIGADLAADRAAIESFNLRQAGTSRVESLEVRVASIPQVEDVRRSLSLGLEVYCELPLTAELPRLVTAVKQAGLRAKVRTGGIKPEDIPAPEAVLALITACSAEKLAFKATAGLHHPLRGSVPLTYELNAARATMFGYLNLILATTLVWNGQSERDALAVLIAQDPAQLRFAEDAIELAGLRIGAHAIERTRRECLIAIGSCSFTEPMSEIRQLGLDPEAFHPIANAAGNRTLT